MTSSQATPPSDPMLTTEIICMSRSRLIATMFYLYGCLPLTVLSVMAVGALIAGIIIDVRWAIVFLMVVFIVTPLLMGFLYFFHGLRQTTASNVVPHTLLFTDNRFTIRILEEKKKEDPDSEEPDSYMKATPKAEDDTEDKTKEEETSDAEKKLKEEKELTTRYEFSIPYSAIERYQSGRDGFIISLKKPHQGFIWLPYTAFSKREDMEMALRRIQFSLKSENSSLQNVKKSLASEDIDPSLTPK